MGTLRFREVESLAQGTNTGERGSQLSKLGLSNDSLGFQPFVMGILGGWETRDPTRRGIEHGRLLHVMVYWWYSEKEQRELVRA